MIDQTQHHGIFVTPGSDDCRIYNVVVIDTGEQLIKASGGTDQAPKSGGSGCFINAASASVSRQADTQTDYLLTVQKW